MNAAVALLLVWLVLARAVTPGLVVSGIVVVAVATWLVPGRSGPRLRWWRLPRLVVDEVAAVTRSTWAVAVETVTPSTPEPAVVELRLPAARPAELAWLATLLTLTPGTYVVDVEPDEGRMTLHLLHGERVDEAIAEVRRLDEDVRALFGDDPGPIVVQSTAEAPT